ncbi:sensor histidine kinase [Paenarthrobacter sp. NPDC058040]|uniref:sensor histidine kinase n=1 Tax=unclassified Paenarthrobacter TaxID=2634190 RepID=UPI0036DF91F5
MVLLAAATLYLLNQASRPGVPEPGAVYAYLDTNDLIKAMILAGAAGVLLAGGVGWISARTAIRPLGDALARQRRFVQDASHEMRTPLAILDARVQLAQRGTTPDTPTAQALALIREDTAVLTGIVNELLTTATAAGPVVVPQATDVGDLTREVVDSAAQFAAEQNITLTHSDEGVLRAVIEPAHLRRAVLGLVENALTHTPPGGAINVEAAAHATRTTITVTDTGPRITGINPERIFDRFARTPRPNTGQGQRNFGIGLALVRDIATHAGGDVQIISTGPHGTSIRITLPTATP